MKRKSGTSGSRAAVRRPEGALAACGDATTPLSNTGVNSGVPHGEKQARDKRGKFGASSVANDSALRQETALVLAALDVLDPVLHCLTRLATDAKEHKSVAAFAQASRLLLVVRGAITSRAAEEGVQFPMPEHVAEGLMWVAAVMRADARMQMVAHSLLPAVSQAKQEVLQ